MHHKRETCRACGGRDLTLVLSLGRQPLANAFLRSIEEAADEPSFPLDVYLCPTCSLVQLLDVIDPGVLFRHYLYVTGTSSTIADHNRRYAERVGELMGLGADDLVVEAASNDGSLLRCFQALGVRTLGVEPARNIAAIARQAGVETIEEFFGAASARDIRSRFGPARAVIGNNVLAHVDDTQDFLRGGAELIADDGLVITEVPYLGDFVDRLEYDTVYHEHLCYFSVTALMRLAEETGLRIVRVERHAVHGGSIRMHAGSDRVHAEHAVEVRRMADAEAAAGLTTLPRF
jgi:novobiocin biosynthesis protein NovU/D-mycarose 3-C-methyltransferase